MEELTDRELINRALTGDHLSFGVLAERHYMTVYRYAFRWCSSREDAEDITQEVFIKLAGKMHLFDNRSRFTTWLYRLTANCARDYARKNSRWKQNILPDPPENGLVASPNPGPENNVITRNILNAVGKLPDKLKEVVLLVYAEGMSHREAADVIGCAETTVSWRIFQAKRQLREVVS
jgi:RNA polymerase sigma-70 factor (ECF subfamily)